MKYLQLGKLFIILLCVTLTELSYKSQSLNTSALTTIETPSALSSRVLNALEADPKTVDLRSQAFHFYSFVVRMLDLFEDEDMVDIITEVSLVL